MEDSYQSVLQQYETGERITRYELDPERRNRSMAQYATGLDICNGPRPGGYFLQKEAWEAVVCAVDSAERAIETALE